MSIHCFFPEPGEFPLPTLKKDTPTLSSRQIFKSVEIPGWPWSVKVKLGMDRGDIMDIIDL